MVEIRVDFSQFHPAVLGGACAVVVLLVFASGLLRLAFPLVRPVVRPVLRLLVWRWLGPLAERLRREAEGEREEEPAEIGTGAGE